MSNNSFMLSITRTIPYTHLTSFASLSPFQQVRLIPFSFVLSRLLRHLFLLNSVYLFILSLLPLLSFVFVLLASPFLLLSFLCVLITH